MLSKGGRRWTKSGYLKGRGSGVACRAQLSLARFTQGLSCPAPVPLCHREGQCRTGALQVFTAQGLPQQVTGPLQTSGLAEELQELLESKIQSILP